MFDIGASELLMIVIVAVVVIGPKDMPAALRTAGRWIGQMRRLSSHFRSSLDAMVREAELEEMERKWREQNEAIMRGSQLPTATEMSPPSGQGSEAAAARAIGDDPRPQAVEAPEPVPSQLPPPPP